MRAHLACPDQTALAEFYPGEQKIHTLGPGETEEVTGRGQNTEGGKDGVHKFQSIG